MLQVFLKNTFVSTIGEEDCQVRLLASPRSKSAELPRCRRSPIDDETVAAAAESEQVDRLNALPGFCTDWLAVASAGKSQHFVRHYALPGDMRASSAGAAHTFRASGNAISLGTTLEGGKALNHEARSLGATQDRADVLRSKASPCGGALECGEVLCGNTQQGDARDTAVAWVCGKAAESCSVKERTSVCELRELQDRLRAACFPRGKVSDLPTFAAKPPAALLGKLGHHAWSTGSVSTMAPDVGSDGEAETVTTASMRRMRKVVSSDSVYSIASTTESFDSLLLPAGMKKVCSSGSINTMASTKDFDLPEVQLGAETEPMQFEFEMSIEESDFQGKGTLQQAQSSVCTPKSPPCGWAASPGRRPFDEAPSPPKERATTAVAAAANAATAGASPPYPPPPQTGARAGASPKQVPRYLNLAEELEWLMSRGSGRG